MKMPIELKAKILYSTVIKPMFIYGEETWAPRRKEEAKLERTEIKMLRWIMGISFLERLETDEIRRRASVVKISVVIRERQLRRYGHVLIMDGKEEVKRAWEELVRGRSR